MTLPIQVLFVLALIIALAKAAGFLSTRLGQPAVLGELLIGIALGPSFVSLLEIPVFHDESISTVVEALAELGVIFLMFMAGLETEFEEVQRSRRVAILAGTGGVILPLVFGALSALAFGYAPVPAVLMGLVLTATSVSISAQTLMELGYLRSQEGVGLLAAAVVDDIIGILLLSVFTALVGGGSAADLVVVFLRMVIFLIGGTLLAITVLPRLTHIMVDLPISEGLTATVITVTLLFAWAAPTIGGIASITGSFLAGLALSRSLHRDTIREATHVITYGLLVPFFFVNIGLHANVHGLAGMGIIFTGVLLLVAILGKVIGCGVAARLAGWDTAASMRLGIGMISRGEVGLIIAGVGLSRGLIDAAGMAIVVTVVLVTTLLPPPLLRAAFRERREVLATASDSGS